MMWLTWTVLCGQVSASRPCAPARSVSGMSLYKRKKKGKELGPWYYLFYIDRKRFTGSTGTTNEREAVKIEARKRVAAENGERIVHKKVVTVRDLISGFQDWVKTINKAPKTIADYVKRLPADSGYSACGDAGRPRNRRRYLSNQVS
jgi:hypothetical protein